MFDEYHGRTWTSAEDISPQQTELATSLRIRVVRAVSRSAIGEGSGPPHHSRRSTKRMSGVHMNTASGFLDVEAARMIAAGLLAEALPRRWSHTVAVAAAAARLAGVLAPEASDEIVCAAWLHDIGYAPDLIETGFHPLDGAAYLTGATSGGSDIPVEVIALVAHHTGAAFEAHERGLHDALAGYPMPDTAKLDILSCADLCSGPDGAAVDPAGRISEVLTRYPTDHPVHRAITQSGPMLIAQSRRVLEAVREAEIGTETE